MGAIMQHLQSVSGTSGRHVRAGQCLVGSLNVRCDARFLSPRPSSPSLTRGNFRSQGDWRHQFELGEKRETNE